MCEQLGLSCDHLRQEATILAALHCQREGGQWEMTQELLSQLPAFPEIELEITQQGTRLYKLTAGAAPAAEQPQVQSAV